MTFEKFEHQFVRWQVALFGHLAEDGTVRGVIYAFLNKTQARTIFSKNASEVPEEENLADLNVASNFACLNLSDDLDGKGIPDACGNTADRLSRNRAEANKRRSVSIRPVVEKLIEKNSSGRFDLTSFGWDLNISNSEQLGLIGLGVPYCVKPRVAEYLVDKKADLNRPLFYVRGNYDRYLRATHLTPIWHGLTRSAETIRVKRLESSEAFWVEISNRDGAQVNFNAQLMPCL